LNAEVLYGRTGVTCGYDFPPVLAKKKGGMKTGGREDNKKDQNDEEKKRISSEFSNHVLTFKC
jgi:hypothetical protein